jgi:hypothetical protein
MRQSFSSISFKKRQASFSFIEFPEPRMDRHGMKPSAFVPCTGQTPHSVAPCAWIISEVAEDNKGCISLVLALHVSAISIRMSQCRTSGLQANAPSLSRLLGEKYGLGKGWFCRQPLQHPLLPTSVRGNSTLCHVHSMCCANHHLGRLFTISTKWCSNLLQFPPLGRLIKDLVLLVRDVTAPINVI